MEKTAQIYYRALVQYMTAMTDFEQAKNYLIQAAKDLYGQDAAEIAAINNAFAAVGIGQILDKSVSGITLLPSQSNMSVGEEQILAANVTPSDATGYLIDWSSSATNVAMVDEKGTVEAVGTGQTIITASVGDVMASTTITVTENTPSISYSVHVQNLGWQDNVNDGKLAGTTGKSLRLEGIKMNLIGSEAVIDALSYRTHVQDYGWLDWAKNGTVSGTVGEAKRLEAIEINLNGEPAEIYDIFYRVHAQNFGWLDWAKMVPLQGRQVMDIGSKLSKSV